MSQIPEKPLKNNAAGNDLLLIRDMTSNTDKRTTVAGIAPTIASSFVDGSVSSSKLDLLSMPYGLIGFNTYGSSGGWASGVATDQVVPFDTLAADAVGVTRPAVGQLQVPTAGNYTVTLRMNAVAGAGTILHIIQVSLDGGSSWINYTPFNNPVTFSDARGITTSFRQRLPANARVRATNNTSTNVRFSAPNAAATSMCSLTVAM